MGTTSDKLTYLNTTKGKIKDVINMTGANITSDTTFRNYATKLYDGYISALKDKNTLLDNMPKGTSTGAITDAADLPVYEDKMSKESSQETTTGVQLANIDDYSTTKLGVNVSCINNEFILNGTVNLAGSLIGSSSSSDILYMATLPPGTYTLSFKKISGSLTYSSGRSEFYIRNSSGQKLGNVSIFSATKNVKGIFTLTKETDVYLQYYVNTSNWEFTNYDFQIMVLSGDYTSSPIPDFEKYTGGIASPNPDYPQEIKTVKGYNNLLNWELPYNVQSAGNIILNNVPQIEIGKSYCFVGKCSDGTILSNANCSCAWYTGSAQILNKAPNKTFEGIDVSNATGFYIYVTSAIVGKTISEFMLVEGTYNNIKNLPYVPYGTNWIYTAVSNGTDTNYYTIPLNGNEIAGIGTYKDELIVDKNGKCWLNKKTGKVVLDGSKNWDIGSSGFFLSANTLVFADRKTSIYNGFCNNFIFNKNSSTWTNKNYCGFNNTNVFWVRDDGEIATTIADWKNWLSTHNTDVYYVLATENLIDLNYTVDIELFKGINNISNSEDMNMEIKYIKDTYE